MSKEVVEVLTKARALIADPARWGKVAPDRICLAAGSDCPLTALAHAASNEVHYEAKRAFIEAIGTGWIGAWNDAPERTHTDVLAAFDRAIAIAESAS